MQNDLARPSIAASILDIAVCTGAIRFGFNLEILEGCFTLELGLVYNRMYSVSIIHPCNQEICMYWLWVNLSPKVRKCSVTVTV